MNPGKVAGEGRPMQHGAPLPVLGIDVEPVLDNLRHLGPPLIEGPLDHDTDVVGVCVGAQRLVLTLLVAAQVAKLPIIILQQKWVGKGASPYLASSSTLSRGARAAGGA